VMDTAKLYSPAQPQQTLALAGFVSFVARLLPRSNAGEGLRERWSGWVEGEREKERGGAAG
jgi:hypothetical protein